MSAHTQSYHPEPAFSSLINQLKEIPSPYSGHCLGLIKCHSTKGDIAELKEPTTAQIAEFKESTNAQIAELRSEMAEFKASMRREFAEFKEFIMAEINQLKRRDDHLQAQISHLKWLMIFNLGFTVTVIWKVFS